MNEELLKFIEFCLVDGVISKKEREVIFRKSEELGVPKDECEIILEGMIHNTNSNYTNDVKTNKNLNLSQKHHKLEDYVNQKYIKDWFKDWLINNKQIKETIKNQDELLRSSYVNYFDSDEFKKNNQHPIQKESLTRLCELKYIKSIPSSFFKKGVEGKDGYVENLYKKEIIDSLENEKFISYTTSSISNEFSIKVNIPWNDKDVNQMIENYYHPHKELDGDWYNLVNNLNSIFLGRDCVLTTHNSIIELHESIDLNKSQFKRTPMSEVSIKTFLDRFGNFKQSYNNVKDFLKSDKLKINHLTPLKIEHKNEIFYNLIEKVGINDFTKRIINVDSKIKEFINQNYNQHIRVFNDTDVFLYVFKEDKTPAGLPKLLLKLNTILTSLNQISFQVFEIYLQLLKYRDNLLNLYLDEKQVKLEGILNSFENSELNMSKYEKDSLSKLDSINKNLVDLKIITKEGLNNLSDDLKGVINKLDSLNESNNKILSSMSFNNLLQLISTYQIYKVNKNIKS